jgi:hypothetical protein
MKNAHDLLLQKERDLARTAQELKALRIVVVLLFKEKDQFVAGTVNQHPLLSLGLHHCLSERARLKEGGFA